MSARLGEVVAAAGTQVTSLNREAIAISSSLVLLEAEHDSRRVGDGMIFACIPGTNADGHDYAAAVKDAGAAALLVDHELDLAIPQIVVSNVREAVGPVAACIHNNPSQSFDVVGVTGTNGKTTTVRMVSSIGEILGKDCLEIGTLTGERTTPEATDLQRILAVARHDRRELVAMEVSSHALDLHRVNGTRFSVAAFTNLGVDHLDHHGDLEAYFAAKALLFTPDLCDLAVIDVRSEAGARMASLASVPVVAIDDDLVEILDLGSRRSRFRWRSAEVDLPLGGAFNVANAALAAEIMVALGVEQADVIGGLAELPTVPGRFEQIDEGQRFAVIVDYAHTPDGLEAVLQAARAVTQRSLIVVFGAGGDRDQGKRSQMGEVPRRLDDRGVVTNDNPRSEDPNAIIAFVVSGMHKSPDLVEPDRRMAIRHAFAAARDGEVVLIAGKGHEVTQTIGADVLEFDDRVVARDELRRLGGANS
ncbi:MAG: UDP-N-acetylmuramoyl-L-alanyl-D-glutamate--2,6-diaminopimelate ligase [Actinobacteria bacterium]|nr:UDP-N-acetylmuramoyl-L-alanyl-D-glutamate--2,6-diaminopimelate ligase [Actinomycetota bacterium]